MLGKPSANLTASPARKTFFNLFANKTSCLIPIFNPNRDGWVHPVVDLFSHF